MDPDVLSHGALLLTVAHLCRGSSEEGTNLSLRCKNGQKGGLLDISLLTKVNAQRCTPDFEVFNGLRVHKMRFRAHVPDALRILARDNCEWSNR